MAETSLWLAALAAFVRIAVELAKVLTVLRQTT